MVKWQVLLNTIATGIGQNKYDIQGCGEIFEFSRNDVRIHFAPDLSERDDEPGVITHLYIKDVDVLKAVSRSGHKRSEVFTAHKRLAKLMNDECIETVQGVICEVSKDLGTA